MTGIFLICLFNFTVIAVQCACNWGPWSSIPQCEWIQHHCTKGFRRYCLCNNIISQGSACSSNGIEMRNYIETKPFASNTISVKGVCFKSYCSSYRNWCHWESWSYWIPVSNTTCKRLRVRKCCESQPKGGYTISLSQNFGCFASKSSQNLSDSDTELATMQCSKYTKWYYIAIYSGTAFVCLLILCIICRCTKSSDKKVDVNLKLEEIQNQEIINPIVPTAPIDEPTVHPNRSDLSKEANNPARELPATPPTYDESIGFSNFTTVPLNEKNVEIISTKSSRSNSLDDLRGGPNTGNLPPPSYALYLGNPILFNQND